LLQHGGDLVGEFPAGKLQGDLEVQTEGAVVEGRNTREVKPATVQQRKGGKRLEHMAGRACHKGPSHIFLPLIALLSTVGLSIL
jgi:hypothetical protein